MSTHPATTVGGSPATVVEPGDYIVEIAGAQNGISKNGNPRIQLHFLPEMVCVDLYDALVYATGSLWAFNQFLASIGINIVLRNGDRFVTGDLTYQRGYVRLGLKAHNGRDFKTIEKWLVPPTRKIRAAVYQGVIPPVRVVRAGQINGSGVL